MEVQLTVVCPVHKGDIPEKVSKNIKFRAALHFQCIVPSHLLRLFFSAILIHFILDFFCLVSLMFTKCSISEKKIWNHRFSVKVSIKCYEPKVQNSALSLEVANVQFSISVFYA